MSYLTKLEFFEQGYAQLGFHLGLISGSDFMKFIYYKNVLFQIKRNGYNKSTAVQITAENMKTSDSTIWRAVHFFEKEPEMTFGFPLSGLQHF